MVKIDTTFYVECRLCIRSVDLDVDLDLDVASGWYSEGINVMYCELVPSPVAIFSFMSNNRV